MTDANTFSVVIPAYNAAATISQAIGSVLRQSHRVHEILVVDDGSRDDTVTIVQEMAAKKPVIQLVSQSNAGPAAARNTGAFSASGQWIAFLDADDYWLPEKMAVQIAILQQAPHLQWVAGRFIRRYPWQRIIETDPADRQPVTDLSTTNRVLGSLATLVNGPSIWTGTVCVRRDAFIAEQGFNTKIRICEDTDLWMRLALKHSEIGYSDTPLSLYTIMQSASLIGSTTSAIEPTRVEFLASIQQHANTAPDRTTETLLRSFLQKKIDEYYRNSLTWGQRELADDLLSALRGAKLPPPSPSAKRYTSYPSVYFRYNRWFRHKLLRLFRTRPIRT